jgi:phospholipase C
MIVVSPYAKPGYVSHTYTDHISVLKFIERNWRLPVLSSRTLDNLPDPLASKVDPYVPDNRPAVGDLFDSFDCRRAGAELLEAVDRSTEPTSSPSVCSPGRFL